MLSRRKFLRQSMLVAGALFSTCSPKALFANTERKRPNIVLMIGDDISVDDFGCYGHPNIRTPNVDKLADGGHCDYCTASVYTIAVAANRLQLKNSV